MATPLLSTCSSAICRNPAAVPGAGLVMSSLTCALWTGSNVSVVGWLDAVAQSMARFFTGVKSRPSQNDTAIEAGRARVALMVKDAWTELNACGAGQPTVIVPVGIDGPELIRRQHATETFNGRRRGARTGFRVETVRPTGLGIQQPVGWRDILIRTSHLEPGIAGRSLLRGGR